jgi:multidrug resistance efflux pump
MFAGSYMLAAALLIAAQPESGVLAYECAPPCVVQVIEEVEVPARQVGALVALALEDGTPVREGLWVRRDQLLGKLDDAAALATQQQADLEHKVAMANEKKGAVSIEAAEAIVQVMKAEVEESLAINRRVPGTITAQQLRRQDLNVDRYAAEVKVAEQDSEVMTLTVASRAADVEVAKLNVERHRIVSPVDGVVVDVLKDRGEWMQPGDTILKIVRLDKLRVQAHVKLADLLPEKVKGREVLIEVVLQDGLAPERFKGVVSFVSPIVDSLGDYRVWADVENRFVRVDGDEPEPVLRPGMNAKMTILIPNHGGVASR